MFCAELMSNMKDVPSTERMVMCSQQWKLLKQNDKDGYQKRCEQVSVGKTSLYICFKIRMNYKYIGFVKLWINNELIFCFSEKERVRN